MRGFGSDNHNGVHPRILRAIGEVNEGHAPAYQTDPLSERAMVMFRHLFGPDASAHFVFNGTAANVLSLGHLVKPFHAVLTAASSHLVNDECGAFERLTGAKSIPIPTADGKLTPESIAPFLVRRGDQHASQVRAISITQSTELGTIYSIEELKRLSEYARSERLFLHMDGARLVNAAAALGVELRSLTTDCDIDVLSVGGTKNGLLFGEAVVFLKRGLDEDFKYTRKQMMQLPSKARFLAAQFIEFLGTNLWRENALHANAMAKRLSEGLAKLPAAQLTQPTQANGVFVRFPRKAVARLKETAFFYVWDEHTFECRLMTGWDTRPEDIDRFLEAVAQISN